MKGLLIKDIRLMANQKQFFMVLGGMCIFFMAIYEEPTFIISYVMVMFSVFTVSTISYDDNDNGSMYLFTLPITRRGYVLEKYVFGLLTIISALVAVSLMAVIMVAVRHLPFDLTECAVVAGASVFFVVLILAVSIPVQLRFGAEKSRMVMIAVMLIIFMAVFMIGKYSDRLGIDLNELGEYLLRGGSLRIVLIVLLAGVAIYGVSYGVSVKVMEKKEF